MKLFKLLEILFTVIFILTSFPQKVKANPIDPRGRMRLIHEEVQVYVDVKQSEISGQYKFKKRNGDRGPIEIKFNLMVPIYKTHNIGNGFKNYLTITHDNSSLQTGLSEEPPYFGDDLSKHCPQELRVQWFKTEDLIISKQEEFVLNPFKISYKQENFKSNDDLYTIYTPLYRSGGTWSGETYKVSAQPKTFTIKFIPKDNIKLTIISEHSKFFYNEGNNLVINFKKYINAPKEPISNNGLNLLEKIQKIFKAPPKLIKSKSWDLFIQAKPIIIKIDKPKKQQQ